MYKRRAANPFPFPRTAAYATSSTVTSDEDLRYSSRLGVRFFTPVVILSFEHHAGGSTILINSEGEQSSGV
ncbi:hypothetical protein TNCV_3800791 [Trichonephila clavipes]|nr:hypothetical protein TNCV_3800791 [Trichonephila clavipes]